MNRIVLATVLTCGVLTGAATRPAWGAPAGQTQDAAQASAEVALASHPTPALTPRRNARVAIAQRATPSRACTALRARR